MPDPFLPPEERRKILREFGKRCDLRYFVETGTSVGDTPAALINDFDHLFTIEVGDAAFQAAKARFGGTKVTCLHGDSTELLPKILRSLSQPALFWLDGHYSGGDRGVKDTPVLEELEAIFATGIAHVILIDDARLFEGMSHYGEHDWPHIDEVEALASKYHYDFVVADDIVRLTP